MCKIIYKRRATVGLIPLHAGDFIWPYSWKYNRLYYFCAENIHRDSSHKHASCQAFGNYLRTNKQKPEKVLSKGVNNDINSTKQREMHLIRSANLNVGMAGASLPPLLPALYQLPSRCLWLCPPGKFHTPIFFTPYFKPHVNKSHSPLLPMPPNKADICSMTVNISNKLSFPSYPLRLSKAEKEKSHFHT